MLAAVPLKGFGSAKTRLGDSMPPGTRARLAAAMADRVVSACARAGWAVVVVSDSAEVLSWCREAAIDVLTDSGAGLDAAATAAVVHADGKPWVVVHGDLPLLTSADFDGIAGWVEAGSTVLAPSRDGGTNLIAGTGEYRFAYGPGSFARHVSAAATRTPLVLVRAGLAVELDTPADLLAARRHSAGAWLGAFLS